jgi:hypothetical protein
LPNITVSLTSLFYIIKSPLRKVAGLSLMVILVITVLSCFSAKAQYFDIEGNHKRTTIPFQMIRELIIIHLKINGRGPFNFVLDSGVGLMLITDPKLVDSINVTDKRTIKISGLGKGEDYEAYITSPLNVAIPGLVSYDVVAAILKTDHFGLSGFAGIPIHGLIGYEFFNNLAVKIDFSDSTLTASKPKYTKFFGKGNKIPITIENRKPFMHARVTFPNGTKAEDKLILDLGAGHPLSLENVIEKHGMPDKFIAANLGVGLTGPIEGFISRLNEVEIGKFKLKNVLASFPVDSQKGEFEREKRDGNLGIGILKRFTLIVDYPDSAVYLKPVIDLDDPFEHDMSGLEYYAMGDDFDHVIISRVEPGSPADGIGLEPGDEIISINFKPVNKMTLEQIDGIFKSKPGRDLLLEIFHDKKYDHVILTLSRRI